MDCISNFLIALARSSAEAGVLVVLILITQWVFQKQLAPRWRCALWLVVVARLLLPFSFSSATSVFNLLPHWTPPAAPAPATAPLPAAAPSYKPATSTSFPTSPAPLEPTPPISAMSASSWSWPVAIFVVWLAGVILLAGYVLVSSLRFWRRCGRLRPVAEPAALNVLSECCARLATRTSPAIVEGVEVGSPALYGLLRPCLLLPKGFTSNFSPEELRFVFLHELAHLKRRDLLVNWVMTAVQVFHWFNPLVWFAFVRWRADRELACDAMALEAAGEARNKDYGRTILRLLESFTHPMKTPGLVGIMEDKRQLRRRIGMIASYVPGCGWPRLAFLLIVGLAVIGLTDAQTPRRSAINSPTLPAATASILSTPAQTKDESMNKSQIAAPVLAGLLALATPATTVNLHADETPPPAAGQSQLADELIGVWIWVGAPGYQAPPAGANYKFFTGSHWCTTHADPKTGVVVYHHGGTYQVKGNEYDESVDYSDPITMDRIGHRGKFTIQIKDDMLTNIGTDNGWRQVWKRLKPDATTADSPLARELTGTWVLVSKAGETSPGGENYKSWVDGYWYVTSADPKSGVVITDHGGTYSLKGNTYSETVDYANPDRMNLIGHTFDFDMKLQGDILTISRIGSPWNEVWKRVN